MTFAECLKYTKMSLRAVLGAEVKSIRAESGLTQMALSLEIGCSENAVLAAETGCTPISPEKMLVMLILLGTEPERIAELIKHAVS